ncbi:MAG TPA: hypothetical protein VK923_01880 [Euzebyales bacterium]|nr:hypothetical protein [Euzebyales bacterium]
MSARGTSARGTSARDTNPRDSSRQGRGRHDNDATRWWDEGTQRWYATTSEKDELEIHAEDYGHTSMLRSIVTTLTGQHGTQRYRFVARIHHADPRWPDSTVASATFPALALQLPPDDIDPRNAFAEEMRTCLAELDTRLLDDGWQAAGMGEHWWSKRYTRPAVDWDQPLDA